MLMEDAAICVFAALTPEVFQPSGEKDFKKRRKNTLMSSNFYLFYFRKAKNYTFTNIK